MKVLLDEQLPHRLRLYLGSHDVFTVDYMGWSGLKNGELLSIAEAERFEVFLTVDKNLSYQQNLAGHRMAIFTLSAIDFDISQAQSVADRRLRSTAPDRARVSRSIALLARNKPLNAFHKGLKSSNPCSLTA